MDDQARIVCPMHHNAFPVEVLLAQATTVKLLELPANGADGD